MLEAQEYSSVTVTIDHLVMDAPDGKVVCKNVWSTETAHESLLAQLDYFKALGQETPDLRDADTFRTVAQGMDQDAAYIYVVNDRHTNIIVDAGLWSEVLSNPALGNGTVLGAHSALIVMATDAVRAAREAGLSSQLFVFVPNASEAAQAAAA